MKSIKFLVVGMLFGVIMMKAEVISWYRIYEMFHFQSFHMYGIIGSAIFLGIIGITIIKKRNLKDLYGDTIKIVPKAKSLKRYLFGGIIFGLGWALTGACPGPMFVLLGTGTPVILVAIAGAILGTFLYGLIRNKLPH